MTVVGKSLTDMLFIPAVDLAHKAPDISMCSTWHERLGANVGPTLCFHLYAQVNPCLVLKERVVILFSAIQPGLSKNHERDTSEMETAWA